MACDHQKSINNFTIIVICFFLVKKKNQSCGIVLIDMGNNVPDICGKTSKEIKDQYPSYTCTKR